MNLSDQKCVPCEVGGAPLTGEEATFYKKDVPEWKVSDDYKKITRNYSFMNFVESMAFVNRVAVVAEEKGHHPDISIHYNKVSIELTTHAMKGLSVNDFIVAAKIDTLI